MLPSIPTRGTSSLRHPPNEKHTSLLAISRIGLVNFYMMTSTASEVEPRCNAHLDANRPVDERVQLLLSQMTLEEKLQQMLAETWDFILLNNPDTPWDELIGKHFGANGIGCVTDSRLDPTNSAKAINALQRYLVEKTRLGIPALVAAECLHGLLSPGATVFPQAIAMASSWNPELLKKMAAATAKEGRAVGVSQALSPDLDLAREPRWGRCEETYGEDPYLTSRLGVAYVQGMQGTTKAIGPDNVACMLKHFAAHGSPESGINLAPVQLGDRELYSTYLPPFRAAVVEGGVASVMTAYSELDGVPSTASKKLFEQILRGEWGFDGYVFSDYGAIEMLEIFHRVAGSPGEAGRLALECGVDMEAPGAYGFGKALQPLVESGRVDMAKVDQAVSRILRLKFLTGLFERPYVDVERATATLSNAEHHELAVELARESIILLKNENGLLPLKKSLRSIAVLGPNADQCQYGDYTCPGERGLTPLQAIRELVSSDARVHFARGCDLGTQRRDGFDEAISLARQSEVAVVFVGETSHFHNGKKWGQDPRDVTSCGEGFDVADLQLPGVQDEFIQALHATGTPLVVVLAHGRPNTVTWIADHVPAILETWYAGQGGGQALAEILFGDVNPSGKLTISVPREVGQVPCFYNYKPSARGYYKLPGSIESPGRDYVFSGTDPLYSFGHGLSYTKFSTKSLRIEPAQIRPGQSFQVMIDLENTGTMNGKEVVQLYIRDVVSSVTVPVRSLRAFRKVALAPGEATRIVFDLGKADLELLDAEMQWKVEAGEFEIQVGTERAILNVIEDSRC